MAALTVVGERFAQPGRRYRVAAPCTEAAGCPIAKICQNQALGQEYRVVAVRPAHHDVCTVFEGGARVVEVEPLLPGASMPSSKLKGTMATWEPPVCHKRGCPNWDTCFNPALVAGARYETAEVHEEMTCPMGHDLRRVVLRPARQANA